MKEDPSREFDMFEDARRPGRPDDPALH